MAASQRFNYTPFGEALGAGPGANTEQGFTGHVEDRTGLVYMQARFYDPAIGRFLQTDPIGYEDQLNLYAYVHNNPVSLYDPFGLRSNCRPMDDTVGTSCSYIDQASTTTSEQVDNERAQGRQSLYDDLNEIEGFYDAISETNPVELAAWEQYARNQYVDWKNPLSVDAALSGFKSFASGFAKDRLNFLTQAFQNSVWMGAGKDTMARGLYGMGAVPVVGQLFRAGSVGMTAENNIGTVRAGARLSAESHELMQLITHNPQVFR